MDAMQNLSEFMSGIPWWVYLIFIYLVNVGIQAMRPRTVSVSKLTVIPLFFLAFSFYGLYQKLLLGFFSLIPLWFVFLAIGIYCGIREVNKWRYQVNHKKGEITIPANYSTLVLLLVLFGFKFFFGSLYATLSEIPTWLYFADVLTSALFTGFFVGRAGVFFRKYLKKT